MLRTLLLAASLSPLADAAAIDAVLSIKVLCRTQDAADGAPSLFERLRTMLASASTKCSASRECSKNGR